MWIKYTLIVISLLSRKKDRHQHSVLFVSTWTCQVLCNRPLNCSVQIVAIFVSRRERISRVLLFANSISWIVSLKKIGVYPELLHINGLVLKPRHSTSVYTVKMDKDLSKFDKSEFVRVIEWLGAVLLLITRCQSKQSITVYGTVGCISTDQSGYPGWPLSPTIHTGVS